MTCPTCKLAATVANLDRTIRGFVAVCKASIASELATMPPISQVIYQRLVEQGEPWFEALEKARWPSLYDASLTGRH
jgi:hypothetical protein